jgi:hypothetical protein
MVTLVAVESRCTQTESFRYVPQRLSGHKRLVNGMAFWMGADGTGSRHGSTLFWGGLRSKPSAAPIAIAR